VVLIDTSVWVTVLRDKTGEVSDRLQEWMAGREPLLTRFSQLELLQGCRNEEEWDLLGD
jgi:predicted nucleic acid-binding protein